LLRSQGLVGRETDTATALPSNLCDPTAANFENASSLLSVLVSKISNERSDILGLEGFNHLRRHDSGSHTSTSVGSNDVDHNVVLSAFKSQSLGQSDNTKLSSRVVGLPKVSVKTDSRASVDDTTILLLEEVGPCSLDDLVCSSKVDTVDKIPVLVGHSGERLVTQNTCIVDKDIDTTKGFEGGFDNLVTILNRVVVGNSLSSSLSDFFYNNVSSLVVVTLASVGTSKVVND
jgi:hypothetical protein